MNTYTLATHGNSSSSTAILEMEEALNEQDYTVLFVSSTGSRTVIVFRDNLDADPQDVAFEVMELLPSCGMRAYEVDIYEGRPIVAVGEVGAH